MNQNKLYYYQNAFFPAYGEPEKKAKVTETSIIWTNERNKGNTTISQYPNT
jgi:hypothetical protein